jgi:hypothetical protein
VYFGFFGVPILIMHFPPPAAKAGVVGIENATDKDDNKLAIIRARITGTPS